MNLVFAAIMELSVPEALVVSVVGMLVVFAVLIILAYVIRLISAFARSVERMGKSDGGAPAAQVKASAALASDKNAGKIPAPGSMGEIELVKVEDKNAALIMAIVADELNTPLNQLRFKSIKAID